MLDQQVISAFLALGLRPFPFDAFDPRGRLISDPKVPDDLKQELGQVLSSPDWARLFATVSVLDDPGHATGALGFRFDSGGISLVAVRGLVAGFEPERTARWYGALWDTVLRTVQLEAGRRYAVRPSWVEALRRIIGMLGRGAEDVDPSDGATHLSLEEQVRVLNLRLALEFVLAILEIANLFGRKQPVACHVIWKWPTWPPMLPSDVPRWSPAGTIYGTEIRTVSGVIWDPRARQIWHWTRDRPWQGLRYSPATLYRAWYPSGLHVVSSAPTVVP